MSITNILVLCGGNSSEHDISLLSSEYIMKILSEFCHFKVSRKVLAKDEIINSKILDDIDYVIPVVHGYPGESGDLASFLDLHNISFFGCSSEANRTCFNKVTTKLWLDALDIPNTPYIFLSNDSEMDRVTSFFNLHKNVFIKASSQGSSIGCYYASSVEEMICSIKKAFKFSPYVLIEKAINGRELEVAVFEYKGKLFISSPGEIISPNHFYSYDEKYSKKGSSETFVEAENISQDVFEMIKKYSKKVFKSLKLKDLCRIDFFLTDNNELYLNEINTFPGMTPISMFPKMVENSGITFSKFLEDAISKEIDNN